MITCKSNFLGFTSFHSNCDEWGEDQFLWTEWWKEMGTQEILLAKINFHLYLALLDYFVSDCI